MRFKQKLLQNIKKQNITKQTGFKKWYEAEDLTKMSKRLAQEKLRDLLKKKKALYWIYLGLVQEKNTIKGLK